MDDLWKDSPKVTLQVVFFDSIPTTLSEDWKMRMIANWHVEATSRFVELLFIVSCRWHMNLF